MHITFGILTSGFGGAERHALTLANHLKHRGHHVSAIVRTDADDVKDAAEAIGVFDDVEVVASYPEAAEVLSRTRPDVFQHFNSFIALAASEIAAPRVPSIQVLHANHALETDFKRLSAEDVDRLVAVSPSVARHFPPMEGDPPIEVIPNGVDPERFTAAQHPPQPPLRMLTVSRQVEGKGVDKILSACHALQHDWQLTVVGDGPERARLKEWSQANCPTRVRFVGRQDDPRPFYGDAHIYVSAARTEGFGLSIAEAMASGLAVVATPCGGITELVEHGRDALVVDPDQLADSLRSLADDELMRRRLGENARALVETTLNETTMVDAYERLYRSLVSEC